MSNLKQLGLGIMMYVQDYDGRFPYTSVADSTTENPSRWNNNYLFWPNFTYPYLKNVQIFSCPSQTSTLYGANQLILTTWANSLPESLLGFPATTYMLMDAGTVTLYPTDVTKPSGYNQYLPGAGVAGATPYASWPASGQEIDDFNNGRHFNGVNVTFADGHVKWLKSEILVAEARKTSGCQRNSSTFPGETCSGSFRYGHFDPGNS